MSNQSFTTHRNRILALAGVALLAVSLAAGTTLMVGDAGAAGIPQASQALPSYADIVAADKPAVVTITTKMKVQDTSADGQQQFEQQFGPNSPYDDFFRQFFGEENPFGHLPQQRRPTQTAMALGSGFIVSSDGMIVTNNHVIDGATDIRVTLDDGQQYKGTLVGHDAKNDLAVVKIDAGKPLPTLSWGDSDKLRAGDAVLAIGNPFGIGTTVTSGIVSARGRDLHNGPYDDFIQVDAAINHGNSGGPLVDADGKVVGINTAIYSPNGGNVGVGFAIPSDQAEAVVAKLETGAKIEHGYIGVEIQSVTKDVADAIGLSSESGALVAQVVDGSPAAKAGLKSGDVVTALGGKPIATPKDLSRLVADMAPGDKADITVWRHGKSLDLSIAAGKGSEEKQASADNDNGAQPGSAMQSDSALGIGFAGLTPTMRDRFGIDPSVEGVIVTRVANDKPAADSGIQRGDIIVSINQQPVTSAGDAMKALKTAEKAGRKSVLLQVERGDTEMFVGVPFGNA
ncbi:DegQ family serine endoprotease [Mesorhizobium sp. 8]|uniref:DegQ family serine endoprotease n=1 Tax=Mesorhizobium sp. 8 TaxID=2584466 RepID=UPI0011204BF4|nr:DegQ family serine endoprotease [Mesorhizobium sp. 8]QDC02174.1 DegQ family serine endoprotease [Mesorhizobium sp. 8]